MGNDVVDLQDPDARPGACHPRFDLRVFTSRERARIGAATAAERVRWTLWAAKESAFKVARKLDDTLPFHPRRFVIQELSEGRAEVVHEAVGRFRIWLEEARDWVHAVAMAVPEAEDLGRRPFSALAVLDGARSSAAEMSDRVRKLVRNAVAPLVPTDPALLKIVSVEGIPEIRLGDQRLSVDLSLSHHGRVVGCSWVLPDPETAGAGQD